MTKRKAGAPNQVLLIQQISAVIEHSNYEFLTDSEKVNKTVLLEGEWNHRIDQFINNYISTDVYSRAIARGLLARLYRDYIPKKVYEWQTKVFKDPAAPKSTRQESVAKLRKLFGKQS